MAERLQGRPTATAEPEAEGAFDCVLAAWHAHESELRGFLINRLGEPEAADDLLQDVFIRAMRQGAGFCQLDSPRAWLFRVTRNAVVDRARRQRPGDPISEEFAAEETETPPVDALTACLERNLATLQPADAEVVRRCDLEGWPHKAYADAGDLSVNAVKTRLVRC